MVETMILYETLQLLPRVLQPGKNNVRSNTLERRHNATKIYPKLIPNFESCWKPHNILVARKTCSLVTGVLTVIAIVSYHIRQSQSLDVCRLLIRDTRPLARKSLSGTSKR